MGRKVDVFLVAGVAAIMLASGLVGYWAAPGDEGADANDSYYQVSTFARLSAGCYKGTLTVDSLLEHGDFGIGTVEGIDGEMMIIDGLAYRAGIDLLPVRVPAGTLIPFAMLTYFETGISYGLVGIDNYDELKDKYGDLGTNLDLAMAVMIEAVFESITIRSVPGQVEPYPPLADVIADQSVEVLHNVRGTVLGFIMSDGLGDINIPGFHLHFLSEDLEHGGHVLDLAFDEGTMNVDAMDGMTVTFFGT